MLVSFILVTHGDTRGILNTLESLDAQVNKDYEVVIVFDKTEADDSFEIFLKNYFWDKPNVKIMLHNSTQGTSISWNVGMNVSEGDYINFIKEGDTVTPDYVEKIQAAVKKHGDVDLIEYGMNLTNMADSKTVTYLEKERVYNLYQEKEPFGYINDLLFNKLFKTEVIRQYSFKFRRFVRYDMLFIYKFLGQAETYVHLDTDPIMSCQIVQVTYSAFDLVNQWPHILNYYRRIGKYKELKDYLNYSYFKVLIHTWLWAVKRYGNKLLIKKAVNFAERKFKDKKDEFTKENKLFALKKDEKFTWIIDNFDAYTKEILKKAK